MATGSARPWLTSRPVTSTPAKLAAYPMLRSNSPTTSTIVSPNAMIAVRADWLRMLSRLFDVRNAPFGTEVPKMTIMMPIAMSVPYFDTIISPIRLAGRCWRGAPGGGATSTGPAVSVLMRLLLLLLRLLRSPSRSSRTRCGQP